MSREIKFRAWDKYLNKMICTGFNIIGEVTVFSGLEIMIQETPIHDASSLDRLLNLEIMQFTGLKDGKGIEIYEGDIVRILYTDWPSNTDPNISLEDYMISISHIGEVVYQAPSFGILFFKEDRYGERPIGSFNYGSHGRLEVIGNIYENSNLINNLSS